MEMKGLSKIILEELWKDSSIKIYELAEKLNVSRQTISKIKLKLWNKNFISSPTILVNPHAVNLQIFFMEIRTNPTEPNILESISDLPEISSIDGILGNYSLIVKFEVSTKLDFADVLHKFDSKIAEQSRFHSYRIIEALDVFKLGGFPLDRPKNTITLDEKKWDLLRLLRKNNNPKKWPEREQNGMNSLNTKEENMLDGLNLSREINTLNKEQIIQRFTIKLGIDHGEFDSKFYLRIKPKNIGEYNKLAQKLTQNPYIIDLYRTGEEAGLLAIVRTRSLKDFNGFIQNLYQTHSILDTHTTVVIDEMIPSIFPPTVTVAKDILEDPKR